MSGRALITGAGGFVGQRLAAHLEEAGWETVLATLEGAPGTLACDVSDRGQVGALLAAAGRVTHVFHLAALTFVPEANRSPQLAFEINLLGTVHLGMALLEQGAAVRLIFVGSGEVYGAPERLPLTEDHPLNPVNPYANSKAAADHFCRWLHDAQGLDVVRMRPFNHSGPGQADHFVLSSFARQVAEIEAGLRPAVVRVGNLDAERDFLHVDDVVRAYEAAALRGRSGAAYNVSSGQARRIGDALEYLRGRSGGAIEVAADRDRMRPVDVPRIEGDHRRLTEDTGWKPAHTFEQLLDDLLRHWRGAVARA